MSRNTSILFNLSIVFSLVDYFYYNLLRTLSLRRSASACLSDSKHFHLDNLFLKMIMMIK